MFPPQNLSKVFSYFTRKIAQAPLVMYGVIWLTSPFKNKTMQSTAAFASILAVSLLARMVFEAVALLGVFAVDLLTGQAVARMDKRGRN